MKLPTLSILAVVGLTSLAGQAFATSALTVAEAGFSAGPGTDYGPAKKLAIGTHVDVIWCGTHANWCLVDIHNKRGWVPMASLTFKVPHAVADEDGGGTGGVTGPAGAGGPAGNPGTQHAKDMATQMAQPPSGGGGIKFSPVNNYSLVKSP